MLHRLLLRYFPWQLCDLNVILHIWAVQRLDTGGGLATSQLLSTHLMLQSLCCSVTQSCPTLCDPVDRSTPGFPVLHYLPVCSNSCPSSWWCHPTISPSVVPFSSCLQSFPASGSLQWISSSHQVAKVLEFQLQHQSFQRIFRVEQFDSLSVHSWCSKVWCFPSNISPYNLQSARVQFLAT